jgi:hypothetical protein
MTSEVRYSIKDYAGKTGKTGIRFANLTAANHDAVNGLMDDVLDAINGVSVGVVAKEDRLMAANQLSDASATDPDAHRGNKWLVSYSDVNSALGGGSFEIPCPDSALLNANSREMNVGAGAGLALVTALEAGMVSRLGNPIQIDKVTFVSRSVS